MFVVQEVVTPVAECLQVCAGQQSGCEAAIHAMQEEFQEVEAILLADATNTFTSLNGRCILHNMESICPAVLRNTYQEPICMFVPSSEEILSTEGTTEGDPLGMAMYSLVLTPLIRNLHQKCEKD